MASRKLRLGQFRLTSIFRPNFVLYNSYRKRQAVALLGFAPDTNGGGGNNLAPQC